MKKHANRLVDEKSPYLLEHATNPVNWYPWSSEALNKAKNDNKPIFLSIGYSTCHWCHQLAKESFENDDVAAFMNKHFISIKVDREERPEIDAYYMSAVQSMTGQGGWPLSVFLTPELKPFYGGTYFPPEPRYGMPSFRQVLEFAAKIWKDRPEEALVTSQQVAASLVNKKSPKKTGSLSREILDAAYASFASNFDEKYGGFGAAPKFPVPLSHSFMLRYHYRTGKEMSLTVVRKSLDAMAAGGIRDHVGGGFHRYSTDRTWQVPHFEKMLYDNALLASLYVKAFQVTRDKNYSEVAGETLDWMIREMEAESGGFFSAQDADTEEGEGIFYTWTPEEVEVALGKEEGQRFCDAYGVTRAGNFEEGRSILHASKNVPEETKKGWMKKLYKERAKRPIPKTDTKILTSWNGLAISALATAGAVLERKDFLDAAGKAADFIQSRCLKGGKLLRRYAGGEAGISGTLEDYSFYVQGLIDLFESSGDPKRLAEAIRLTNVMVDDMMDRESGGFYMTTEDVPAKIKESYDGPTPSGNSVAAMNLLRLSELSGDTELRKLAENTLDHFQAEVEDQPTGHALMLEAFDNVLNGMKEVVISGPTTGAGADMIREVRETYMPELVLIVAGKTSYRALAKNTSLLEGREPGPKAIAYVCQNFACKLPARSAEELRSQLKGKGR